MNFRDFYGNPPRISVEIFPPKEPAGIASLFTALRELSRFDPAFISVTYGAMGATRDLTRDLALRIQRELDLTTAFHFTCVGSDRRSIRDYVEYLKREGLNLVVALRGDPPGGTGSAGGIGSFTPPPDGFAHANELVTYLNDLGGFSIAVAGYPEGHIEAPDKETDLKNLVRKVNAGADVVLTQLFFDNRDFFDFTSRARQAGIRVPIIPGIMPIGNLKQIEKITRMCGARIPPSLHEELSKAQEDPVRVRDVGIRHAILQCRELLEKGAPGIHFYSLNRSESTGRILDALRAEKRL